MKVLCWRKTKYIKFKRIITKFSRKAYVCDSMANAPLLPYIKCEALPVSECKHYTEEMPKISKIFYKI